jgi:bifunctional DNA primase/polymerase-like protein
VIVVPPPEKNLGPPRNAEGAPIPKTDTPTDHSNTDINSIRTPVSRYTGPWLVDFALNRIALAPVIPLQRGSNIPHRLLGSGWSPKAGTVGSQDRKIIKAWWAQDPIANIGIVTAVSPRSHLLVIDIDTKPGKPNGWESIFNLMNRYQERLPETTSVTTPSGGTHLYYAMPEGDPSIPFRPGWLPGVDIPWLVPVPPSAKWRLQKLQDGSLSMPDPAEIYEYRWASIVEPLPVAPAWLLADIRNRGKKPQVPKLRAHVRNEPKHAQGPIGAGSQSHSTALPPTALFIENGLGWFTGSRDADCFRLACRLWFQYGDEATVVGVIFKAWERSPAKDHRFSWQDAYRKIKQAERYWLEDREQILRRAESLITGSR